jgi:hypothetical protein
LNLEENPLIDGIEFYEGKGIKYLSIENFRDKKSYFVGGILL